MDVLELAGARGFAVADAVDVMVSEVRDELAALEDAVQHAEREAKELERLADAWPVSDTDGGTILRLSRFLDEPECEASKRRRACIDAGQAAADERLGRAREQAERIVSSVTQEVQNRNPDTVESASGAVGVTPELSVDDLVADLAAVEAVDVDEVVLGAAARSVEAVPERPVAEVTLVPRRALWNDVSPDLIDQAGLAQIVREVVASHQPLPEVLDDDGAATADGPTGEQQLPAIDDDPDQIDEKFRSFWEPTNVADGRANRRSPLVVLVPIAGMLAALALWFA